MKIRSLVSIFTVIVTPAFGHSATEPVSACQLKERQRMRMKVVATNIANISSTRMPQGGPYQRKEFDCSGASCKVSEVRGERLKYEPRHPDARADGYVAYPNIDLMEELADMIAANREYERLLPGCPDKADDQFKNELLSETLPRARN